VLRAIDLRGAIAINVITMVGIGPLITLPLVVAALHEHAIVAWLLGALLAACDGLVYAELGSLYPGEGGTYVYLREAYGPEEAGRFFSFLFIWQFVLSTPLIIASGYIGFASYAAYLAPALANHPTLQSIVGCGVGLLTIALLYRAIPAVVRVALFLGAVAVATLLIVALSGAYHTAPSLPATHFAFGALGGALVITLYDYLGYGEICALGSEIRRPERTIPLSIVLSIGIVAVLYCTLQLGILRVVPWSEAAHATSVAALAVERTWGTLAAQSTAVLILITAFASTYGLLLGSSRIPYAAAETGLFFSSFARLHPRAGFPYVSLLAIGLLALPATFLPLDQVIAALTTGLIIAQSLAQIGALALIRRRRLLAPFRMWFYPLPAVVALAGWLYVFVSAGTFAITFGLLTLLAGIVAYLVRARPRREWPFAPLAGILCAFLLAATPPHAQAATTFTAAKIVQRGGYPVFLVHGKPFFVYGAAFFYERLPRSEWRDSLLQLRALGINTIDLYVMWNWHEPAQGEFDFTGRTNPRRDLEGVLHLVRELGFYAIVRPGPVIRNEWRNGGYPAWLLSRPEYGMPLHDLLEGRYPPIATLQNAHSDDAAAAWLANSTHLHYARLWLTRVLHEIEPYADCVIAIQLDDDQGAYIDNQTWPAPHLQEYLRTLAAMVRSVAGPSVPLFINTYEMKVTPSAPVWAMGNWYQSDALVIGEHDRSSLEFATGLLQTQPHLPVMLSEFQAGWLAPPDDVRARQTDPSNTTLALHTLLGMGLHGVVNFPAQDTLYPSGWEVPFANAFYAWEAALGLDLRPSVRYAPTKAFGDLVRRYGSQLAQTHRVADAAVAYTTSAFDARDLSNDDIFAIAARTQSAQRYCRLHSLACDLVDLRYADASTLHRYRILLLPIPPFAVTRKLGFVPAALTHLAAYQRAGGRLIRYSSDAPPESASRALGTPVLRGVDGALLEGGGARFIDAVNYTTRPVLERPIITEGDRSRRVSPFVVPARSARLIPLESAPGLTVFPLAPRLRFAASIPVRPDALLPATGFRNVTPHEAIAYRSDVYGDGEPALILENTLVRIIIAPEAGARAFVFEDKRTHANVFTSVGAMRDDVSVQPPPSTTDRLGASTHAFPAGMFNRPYEARIAAGGSRAEATLSYDAPDVVPHGARFERTITLDPDARTFRLDERFIPHGTDAGDQQLVSTSSLAVGDAYHAGEWSVLTPAPQRFRAGKTISITSSGTLGFYDAASRMLASIRWSTGDAHSVDITEKDFSLLARITFASGASHRLTFGFTYAPSVDDARAELAKDVRPGSPKRVLGRGSGGTGLRSRLKSDRVKTLVGSNPTFPREAHG
jgi:amino acid transporter